LQGGIFHPESAKKDKKKLEKWGIPIYNGSLYTNVITEGFR
jgi:hypothetical protein